MACARFCAVRGRSKLRMWGAVRVSADARRVEIALGLCGILAYGVHASNYVPRRQADAAEVRDADR